LCTTYCEKDYMEDKIMMELWEQTHSACVVMQEN
jgi:hypothetical protein